MIAAAHMHMTCITTEDEDEGKERACEGFTERQRQKKV